jgi:hypothetical protein
MAALAFDTHASIKRMTSMGMPMEQAEVLAEENAKLIEERLVTREYLDRRLAEVEAALVKWVFGAIGIQVIAVLATMFGLAKLLGH